VQETPLPRPSRRRGVYTAIIAFLVVGTLVATALLVALLRDIIQTRHIPVPELPAEGAITLAFAGDTTRLVAARQSDPSYIAVANAVRRATLGFTSLEMSLPNPKGSRDAAPIATGRVRLGPDDGADIVRSLGFDWVSLANLPAADLGEAGLRSTTGALEIAGVLHAGAGPDRAAALRPAVVGQGSRAAALIAVDLAQVADSGQLLDAVRRARQQAPVVIVAVADGGGGSSDEPASRTRQIAHDVIDAGAVMVIGHGPPGVRGVELYKGHPIFYSLGHFADDAGRGEAEAGPAGRPGEPRSEGLLVTATFAGLELSALEVLPLDLSGRGPGGTRGIPALGTGEPGRAILSRFSVLSEALGTPVQIEDQSLSARVPIYEKR
jgi:poly-gamma-glutamate synthesis protein (capsule biosynthesis protein)